ncbi:TIGR02444 family protein [Gayadomonas joobiniege]|uniref:TIGR02444 family protein n=1 Tax=Gayadomonas joobiniege TaxID=1234606 RepID=UPI00036E3E9C|nr:TIGR02444 family protein [Gayadomonas joobiniege]
MPQLTFLVTDAWQYSLAIYGKKQIKEICLSWQDAHQANVNLLLLLSWLDTLSYQLPAAKVEQLHQQITAFSSQFTQPQRMLRRAWCAQYVPPDSAGKQSLLQAELVFERHEQALICQFFNQYASLKNSTQATAKSTNLHSYLELLGIDKTHAYDTFIAALSSVPKAEK